MDERQKLKDYLNNQITVHGLSGVSGANFKDSISPNGKIKFKQNTTVEEYVDAMSDNCVRDFNAMNDAYEKKHWVTCRESMYLEEFVPDLNKMLNEETYSTYQTKKLIEYGIKLENKLRELLPGKRI